MLKSVNKKIKIKIRVDFCLIDRDLGRKSSTRGFFRHGFWDTDRWLGFGSHNLTITGMTGMKILYIIVSDWLFDDI